METRDRTCVPGGVRAAGESDMGEDAQDEFENQSPGWSVGYQIEEVLPGRVRVKIRLEPDWGFNDIDISVPIVWKPGMELEDVVAEGYRLAARQLQEMRKILIGAARAASAIGPYDDDEIGET